MTINFNKICPEQAGIPSEAVINLIKQLEETQVNMHGVMMLWKGNVIAEGYWKPFHKDFLHRMYSVGKSFTSLAIGLLQEEGKIHINDFICDYFPEKLPEGGVHNFIKAMTIKDMLCMTSAHKLTTYKRYDSDDWVESFFHVEPSHLPGTVFSYDTSATHVLAALVEKLTGIELIEYLRIKFLDKIGFSEDAYWLKDPLGVTQGGSGLVCTMRDLAKVASVCTNGGMYQGEQILPANYLKEATKKQVDTSLQPFLDEQQGYGYQIWKSRNDGFCFYGMGGQLAVCFPQYDFVFVSTADTQGYPAMLQNIYDAFYQQVFPYIQGKLRIQNDKQDFLAATQLQSLLQQLEKKPLVGDCLSIEKNLSFTMTENPMKIDTITIEFKENEGYFRYENELGKHSLHFGIGEFQYQKFPGTEYHCMCSGAWVNGTTFHIQVNVIDECFATLKISACFKDDQITLFMKRVAENFLLDYEGVAVGQLI